jgi:secreted trypsin-like serine protease
MKVAFLLICWISVVRSQGQYQCNVTAPCGCSPSKPTTILNRIVGGENAQKDAWPWMVSIRKDGEHLCGGSILDSQFILTAAHCLEVIYRLSSVTILAGSLTVQSSGNKVQLRSIDRKIRHQGYESVTNNNDLGLIRLATPLDLTGNSVRPICLPTSRPVLPKDNTTMVGIGWGTLSPGDWEGPSILQQVTVRSINRYMFGCPSILYHPRQQFCAGLPKGGKGSVVSPLFPI